MSDANEAQISAAPTWLQRRWGTAWNAVFGFAKDSVLARARLSIKARFAELAPDDALPLLLRTFDLDPPFGETAKTMRARLARAWELWRAAGTKAGLVAALNAAGYQNVSVQENVDPARWWTFRVVLRHPLPWDTSTYRPVRWGAGWLWGGGPRYTGSGAPVGERERVLAMIHKWKPAHAVLLEVTIQLQGPFWGDFRWGDGTRYGGIEETWIP